MKQETNKEPITHSIGGYGWKSEAKPKFYIPPFTFTLFPVLAIQKDVDCWRLWFGLLLWIWEIRL